jgi:O-antigen/teichoic acid export membrane protein
MSQANLALKGALILTITKLSERLLGLVSTLILARLLLPEDFGIIAVTLLVINFIQVITDTGGGLYIISKDEVDHQDINTFWTIDIILKLLVFFILLAITPIISGYYDDVRLLTLLPALALMIPIGAFTNPYLVILRRTQNYKPILKMDIIKKVLSISVTITVALIYQNYWALIAGHLTSNIVKLIYSFMIFDYRPKFTLVKFTEQWSFSKWMLAKGVLGYSRSQLDTFLVSSFYSPANLGGYHVSKYISNMPGTDAISPALEPLLASYSRNKRKPENFKHQVMLTLLVIMATAPPLATFMYFNSTAIVSLILGDKWLTFSKVFGILSLLVIPLAIGRVAGQVLTSQGKVKILFYYDLLSLTVMAGVLLSLTNTTLEAFSIARVAIDCSFVTLLFIYSTTNIFKKELLLIVFYFISVILGALSLGYFSQIYFLTELPIFISLTLSFIIFCLTWLVFCYFFFYLLLRNNHAALHLKHLIQEFGVKFSSQLDKFKH